MERISEFIVKKRKWILASFIVFVVISAIASTYVKVNHDMVQYLPDSSSVKKGVNLMSEEFEEVTSISVMFGDLDSEGAMQQMKSDLASIEEVSSVTFDSNSSENVKDGYALYTVNIDGNAYGSKAQNILKQIQSNYSSHEMYVAGSVVDQAEASKGMSMLIIVALSILLVILFVMCHSWIEPFLFLIPIGMAVMINSGTNVMFSSISSMTSSVASILQLALSMDYSFMVMERYRQEQKLTSSKETAMQKALAHGFVSISSSSVTTIVGMICLVFMSFTIGKDMGLVLAKGVLISLICIFCVLPALILMFDKALMKTKKPVPVFKMNKIAAFSYKFRYGILVLFVFLLAGSFIVQGKSGITYAVESTSEDKTKIQSIFPAKTSLVVLYDNEDEDQVSSVIPELETIANVDAVEDPRFAAFFDDEAKEQLSLTADTLKTGKQSLVGEHYSRLIVTTSYGGESDEVYDLIDQMIEKLDGTEAQYYIIGDSAMSKELSGSFAQELLFITLLTAVAIFLVVAVAFRSISIPIILVGVIQCAIFTIFSVAYFQGISTYFICLLIVQAILMGASIDYAILFTSYYKVERLNHSIKDAITASYNGAISTILTSASILVIVTFAISKVFSDPTTSQVCSTISKGALVATILVIFVLPSLLAVFDRFVVRKGKREDA